LSTYVVGLCGDVCVNGVDGDAASSEMQKLIEGYIQQAEQLRFTTSHSFIHSFAHSFIHFHCAQGTQFPRAETLNYI